MHRNPKHKLLFISRRAKVKHKKFKRRYLEKRRPFLGWVKFVADVVKKAKENKRPYKITPYFHERRKKILGPLPKISNTIEYLNSKRDAFSKDKRPRQEDGNLKIPRVFSLTDAYSESFSFLKRLYYALYLQSTSKITLDYDDCEKIDLDASVCMDILLGEFILYIKKCRIQGHQTKIQEIIPINFNKPHIRKILFSIGAFASIKNLSLSFPDIIPYKLCVARKSHPKASAIREVDITKMVEYVIKSMQKMNKTLTPEAEDNLFKVIGEVLINAEEHSTCDYRYSIGYFQDLEENGEHIGIFNLVILNFGKTIYETFSDPNCANKSIVRQMEELSSSYVKRGLFSAAKFEEQTLWTLYALQEEVTSKADWKRGNGSIRFIDSFFNLKGGNDLDNISYLSIVSGNTRIIFDGTYRLIEKVKGKNRGKYKMMTFNSTGDIEDEPDKNFVTFAENYFPGTIISAKICIKEKNTEVSDNEQYK